MIKARHLTKRYGKTVAVDQPVPWPKDHGHSPGHGSLACW